LADYWSYGEVIVPKSVTAPQWSYGELYPNLAVLGQIYEAAAAFAVGAGLGQTPALILNPAMGLQAGAGMAPGSQGDFGRGVQFAALAAVDWQAAQALAAALNLNAAALAAYDLRGDWGAELGMEAGVRVDSQAGGDFIAAMPLSVLAVAELLAGRTVLATAPLGVRAEMVAGISLEQSANLALAALTALEISGQQVIVASVGLDAVAAWGLEAAADLLAAAVLGGRAEFTLNVPSMRIVQRGNRLLVMLFSQGADLKLS